MSGTWWRTPAGFPTTSASASPPCLDHWSLLSAWRGLVCFPLMPMFPPSPRYLSMECGCFQLPCGIKSPPTFTPSPFGSGILSGEDRFDRQLSAHVPLLDLAGVPRLLGLNGVPVQSLQKNRWRGYSWRLPGLC